MHFSPASVGQLDGAGMFSPENGQEVVNRSITVTGLRTRSRPALAHITIPIALVHAVLLQRGSTPLAPLVVGALRVSGRACEQSCHDGNSTYLQTYLT